MKGWVEMVLIARVLAGIVVGLALMQTIYFATQGPPLDFWFYVGNLSVPLGISVLILVAIEILRSLRTRE